MLFSRIKEFIWPVVGLLAVIFSGWLLYKEFAGLSAGAVLDSLMAIPAGIAMRLSSTAPAESPANSL